MLIHLSVRCHAHVVLTESWRVCLSSMAIEWLFTDIPQNGWSDIIVCGLHIMYRTIYWQPKPCWLVTCTWPPTHHADHTWTSSDPRCFATFVSLGQRCTCKTSSFKLCRQLALATSSCSSSSLRANGRFMWHSQVIRFFVPRNVMPLWVSCHDTAGIHSQAIHKPFTSHSQHEWGNKTL